MEIQNSSYHQYEFLSSHFLHCFVLSEMFDSFVKSSAESMHEEKAVQITEFSLGWKSLVRQDTTNSKVWDVSWSFLRIPLSHLWTINLLLGFWMNSFLHRSVLLSHLRLTRNVRHYNVLVRAYLICYSFSRRCTHPFQLFSFTQLANGDESNG